MVPCKCCSSDKLDFTTKEVNSILRDGVINVSLRYRDGYWDPIDQLTLEEAIEKVPQDYRSPLRIIQFLNKEGYNEMWTWRGLDVEKEWGDINFWVKSTDDNTIIDEVHIKDGAVTQKKLSKYLQDNLAHKAVVYDYNLNKLADVPQLVQAYKADTNKSVFLVYKSGMYYPAALITQQNNEAIIFYQPEGTNFRKVILRATGVEEVVIYGDTVRYGKQFLTDAQKQQAKQNIDAGTKAYIIELTQSSSEVEAIIEAFQNDENKSQLYVKTSTSIFPANYDRVRGVVTTIETTVPFIVGSEEPPRIDIIRYSYYINSHKWSTDNFPKIYRNVVSYESQVPSESEQEQARKNIGALSSEDGAVQTANIKDYAVIGKKISSGAITNDKIRAGAVSIDKLNTDLQSKVNDNVKYVEQTLTKEQQLQARKNIGALSSVDANSVIEFPNSNSISDELFQQLVALTEGSEETNIPWGKVILYKNDTLYTLVKIGNMGAEGDIQMDFISLLTNPIPYMVDSGLMDNYMYIGKYSCIVSKGSPHIVSTNPGYSQNIASFQTWVNRANACGAVTFKYGKKVKKDVIYDIVYYYSALAGDTSPKYSVFYLDENETPYVCSQVIDSTKFWNELPEVTLEFVPFGYKHTLGDLKIAEFGSMQIKLVAEQAPQIISNSIVNLEQLSTSIVSKGQISLTEDEVANLWDTTK